MLNPDGTINLPLLHQALGNWLLQQQQQQGMSPGGFPQPGMFPHPPPGPHPLPPGGFMQPPPRPYPGPAAHPPMPPVPMQQNGFHPRFRPPPTTF